MLGQSPPQSMSVSEPLWIPSSQAGAGPLEKEASVVSQAPGAGHVSVQGVTAVVEDSLSAWVVVGSVVLEVSSAAGDSEPHAGERRRDVRKAPRCVRVAEERVIVRPGRTKVAVTPESGGVTRVALSQLWAGGAES